MLDRTLCELFSHPPLVVRASVRGIPTASVNVGAKAGGCKGGLATVVNVMCTSSAYAVQSFASSFEGHNVA